MIAIIDYGVGNLFSLSWSLKHIGLNPLVTRSPEEVCRADKIILPGVGAFGDAMNKLASTGLIPVLKEQAAAGKPLLGICLGMQMLFQESFEYGRHAGLALIPGRVCPLEEDLRALSLPLKVPHIGWNSLDFAQKDHPLLKNTKEGDYVYYVHSFYAKDCASSVVASSLYGVPVPGVVACGSVIGCQFHPEKSGAVGLAMLRAFAEI